MANTHRFTDIFSKKQKTKFWHDQCRTGQQLHHIVRSYNIIYSLPIYNIPLEALCTIINTT